MFILLLTFAGCQEATTTEQPDEQPAAEGSGTEQEEGSGTEEKTE
jgi:hypothetical protein